MGTPGPRGVTLDAGALIAFDRGDERVRALVRLAVDRRMAIIVPAGALAQAWRDGARQARLSMLVGSPSARVEVLDEALAKVAGALCGRTNTADVIDVRVALAAMASATTVLTSDPDDIRKLARTLAVEPV